MSRSCAFDFMTSSHYNICTVLCTYLMSTYERIDERYAMMFVITAPVDDSGSSTREQSPMPRPKLSTPSIQSECCGLTRLSCGAKDTAIRATRDSIVFAPMIHLSSLKASHQMIQELLQTKDTMQTVGSSACRVSHSERAEGFYSTCQFNRLKND